MTVVVSGIIVFVRRDYGWSLALVEALQGGAELDFAHAERHAPDRK